MPPSIGIVGSGAVARALGRALWAARAPLVAVASRSVARAAQVAASLGPDVRAVPVAQLPDLTSHVIVATADDQIAAAAEMLVVGAHRPSVALHTCGARGPDALALLRNSGASCGLFHPLQTFVADAEPAAFHGITFGLAGDEEAVAWGRQLAALLGASVVQLDPEHLGSYHAAAVLSSNALAALIDGAVLLMQRAGVDPEIALRALEPLSRSALDNVFRLGPAAALTGPIARGDATTVVRHLDAIRGAPGELDGLYRAVSRWLVDLARRGGHAGRGADDILALLDTERDDEGSHARAND